MRTPFATAMLVAALATPSAARADQFFSWAQGQPTKMMVPAAANYCYLTRLSGKFRGYGERVRVRVINGNWQIEGASQQEGVAGWARCFARSEIKAGAGAVRWSSEEISATADNPGSGCVDTNPRNAWWGDAATVMTLFTGALEGGGERVTITQSGDPFGPSILVVHSCQKQTGFGAHSFFVGTPSSGKAARFIGPKGVGTAGQAGEFVSIPNQDVLLAPLAQAFCYFTEIGGAFNGGGESVTILPGADANGGGRWVLQARHASGSGTWAKARCYARTQG